MHFNPLSTLSEGNRYSSVSCTTTQNTASRSSRCKTVDTPLEFPSSKTILLQLPCRLARRKTIFQTKQSFSFAATLLCLLHLMVLLISSQNRANHVMTSSSTWLCQPFVIDVDRCLERRCCLFFQHKRERANKDGKHKQLSVPVDICIFPFFILKLAWCSSTRLLKND